MSSRIAALLLTNGGRSSTVLFMFLGNNPRSSYSNGLTDRQYTIEEALDLYNCNFHFFSIVAHPG